MKNGFNSSINNLKISHTEFSKITINLEKSLKAVINYLLIIIKKLAVYTTLNIVGSIYNIYQIFHLSFNDFAYIEKQKILDIYIYIKSMGIILL